MSQTQIAETMEESMKKAIEQHLPAQLSGVLQERLKKGDEAIERVHLQRAELDVQQKKLQDALQEISKLNAELGKHTELAKREEAVKETERNLQVKEMTLQLAAERRISETMVTTLNGLVRNTEYRSNAFGTMPVSVGGGGGSGFTSPDTVQQHPTSSTGTARAE